MKSFQFTTLACLLLSAAQVEAISSEVDAQIDMSAAAELEHHHVSSQPNGNRKSRVIPVNATIQRNGAYSAN